MTYDELSKEIAQLGYRDKLRLAQLLIHLAQKDGEGEHDDRRQSSASSGPRDVSWPHPGNAVTTPLGYNSARNVLTAGRAAFFGGADVDLPTNRSQLLALDDRTPQFGYVGAEYPKKEKRVLFLGINPGTGTQTRERTETDARMMPALIQFAQNPTPENFEAAQRAYKAECQSWPIWERHCKEVIDAGKLSLEDIAYSNCLPWRAGSNSAFDEVVREKAAVLYAYPLIEELQPTIVIAMGKVAAEILSLSRNKLPHLIVWNRARVASPSVQRERREAAAEVFRLLRHDSEPGGT